MFGLGLHYATTTKKKPIIGKCVNDVTPIQNYVTFLMD